MNYNSTITLRPPFDAAVGPALPSSEQGVNNQQLAVERSGSQALVVVGQGADSDTLERVKLLVLDCLNSTNSKLCYARSLDRFIAWLRSEWRGPFNRASVQRFKSVLIASGLQSATVNQRLAAVKKLASEACENSLLDPVIAAGIARVHGVPKRGVRTGNWLTLVETKKLLRTPGSNSLVDKRDTALLAVFCGAGLRRQEIVDLTFDHIQLRDGRWCIVDIVSKHGHIRTVPIGQWVKDAIDEWATAAGISSGIVFRGAYSLRFRGLHEGRRLTPQAVFKAVKRHAEKAGLSIGCHDLRRSFAKLARKGGSPIEQIKESLGHSSVRTTEFYLGTDQDLQDAPADRLGIDDLPRPLHRRRRRVDQVEVVRS